MDGVNDIRLAFDQVPELYERIRPGYPDELFDLLFDTLPAKPAILEVGPGTGQATAGLIERGAEVTAVEIGPRLAAALEDKFQQAPADRMWSMLDIHPAWSLLPANPGVSAARAQPAPRGGCPR